MSDFLLYLRLGFDHITDPRGYDHILFVVALCAVYSLAQWRQVLVLVTAFTLGHSITLALATLRFFTYRTDVVELLIPVTILVTSVLNLFVREPRQNQFATRNGPGQNWGRYGLALVFGLVHGLGFANYLRSLLGAEADLLRPLLAFNIGLELGQLLVVAAVLAVAHLVLQLTQVRRREWVLVLSGGVADMAISLLLANKLVAG